MEGLTITKIILEAEGPGVIIDELRLEDPNLYSLLEDMDEEERKDYIIRALRVGIEVLQVMDTSKRVDYVHGEFERMQTEINTELKKIFSEEGQLQKALDQFLGENGELKRTLNDHFGERGSVIYKILNPDDESTPLGKFRKQLQQELNADQENTAFYKMKKTIDEGIQKVLIALGAAEAAAIEREKSPAKGADLENYVYEILDKIARDYEDTVELVGTENGSLGKVGDILVRLNPRDTRNVGRSIVVEVKNRPVTLCGKNSFLMELESAKKNRSAQYAIGAIHETQAPLAIGCFRRYEGNNIICSVPMDDTPLALEIAYKVARAELVASALKGEIKLDLTQLQAKITEIQNRLATVQAIKSALTGATGKIDTAKGDLEDMESSIKRIIDDILIMIKSGNTA
ncbi:MAG: hypothetical protein QXH91_01470 [Candidatus Bathyarchaeia archaeon]